MNNSNSNLEIITIKDQVKMSFVIAVSTILCSIVHIYSVSRRSLPDMYYFYSLRTITYTVIFLWLIRIIVKPIKITARGNMIKEDTRSRATILFWLSVMVVHVSTFYYFRNGYKNWNQNQQRLNELFDAAPSANFSDGGSWLNLGENCNYVLTGMNACKDYIYPRLSIQLNLLLQKLEVIGLSGYKLLIIAGFITFSYLLLRMNSTNLYLITCTAIMLISPPMMYAIDRGQLDFPILILTTSSFLLLFKSNQTKVEFSLGVSFFSIAVALKIFPILVLPLFIFYFRGLKLYVILFTNLAIVLHGFLNGWIYVIQNLVEPTLQGSGFLNLFKLTSGDYSQSLLSSKTETIFKIVTLCLLIYMGAKLRTTILNPPGLLIALHFIMWSVGINHLYKNIFLVTGIMLLLGKVRMNNLHNHFLIVVVLLINVFLGKADILINISNLGLLMLLGTKLLLSKYRIKRLK